MLENYKLIETLLTATWLFFAFAFGACVGSLTNVLVYRLPRGLDVVSPSSRCPSCETVLTWRENVPVIGWLALRGRCRFCKSAISPEYPLVEAFVGLLFVGLYVLWFIVPMHARGEWLGVEWALWAPEWTRNGFAAVWPTYVITVVLLSSLVAMTLIDARTFQIPLVLTWVPMLLGVVGHTGHALWIERTREGLRFVPEGEWWMIPTGGPFGWVVLGLALGGCAGLVLSGLLQKIGVFKQSFADYAEWEEKAIAEAKAQLPDMTGEDGLPNPAPSTGEGEIRLAKARVYRGVWVSIALGVIGGAISWLAWSLPLAGIAIGLIVGVPLAGLLSRPKGNAQEQEGGSIAELWIQYPHARREALRELVWVTPAVTLACVGAWLGAGRAAPQIDPISGMLSMATPMPLWLSVLGGGLLGMLVGGGVVWAIRIFGSLGFGKEAMGMGDVWLMAAVGACLGWMDAVLIFFVAPFIALYLTAVLWAWDGSARRALPYGPSLGAATLLVVFGETGFEWLLGQIWRLENPMVLP